VPSGAATATVAGEAVVVTLALPAIDATDTFGVSPLTTVPGAATGATADIWGAPVTKMSVAHTVELSTLLPTRGTRYHVDAAAVWVVVMNVQVLAVTAMVCVDDERNPRALLRQSNPIWTLVADE
jgi:hypothetical protein